MRGVSSSTGSATVGLYLDDAPITTDMIFGTGAFIPSFFDLNRVEVLRGPQGTLYGASSEGGTVRFVLNEPDVNQFSGKASADTSYTAHGGMNTQRQESLIFQSRKASLRSVLVATTPVIVVGSITIP